MRLLLFAVAAATLLMLAAPALAANNMGAGNRACDASHGVAAAHADARTEAINCGGPAPPPE